MAGVLGFAAGRTTFPKQLSTLTGGASLYPLLYTTPVAPYRSQFFAATHASIAGVLPLPPLIQTCHLTEARQTVELAEETSTVGADCRRSNFRVPHRPSASGWRADCLLSDGRQGKRPFAD